MEQNSIKQRFKELKKNRDTSIQKAVETPKGRTDVPVPNSPLRSTAFFSTEAPQPSETTQFGFTGNGVDLSVPATEKPIKFPQHVELKNGKSWGQFNPYALAEGREPFGYESSRKDDYLKMINTPSPAQEQAPRSYFGVSNKALKADASAEAKAELRRRNQMNVAVSRISSMSAIDKNRLMNAISAGYDTIDELDGAKRQYDLNREKELKEIERRANRTREEIADEFFSTQSEVYKLDRLNALNEALTARWDELEKVRESEIAQNASKGGGMHALAGAMSSSIDNSNKKDSYSRYLGYTLNRIRQSLNIATQASQLHKREKDGFFTNLAEGFVDNVTDPYKMLPFVQGGDEKLFSNLIDKYNKNEKLTKEESELLDAVAFANYIEGELSQTLGKDYGAGDITAQALPFIAEIAIAGLSGGTVAGAVGQRIGRAIGKKGLKKLAERGIVSASGKLTRWGTKLAGAMGRVVGDAITSLGMTVTTGAGYTYNDMMQRLNPHLELNEEGTGAGNVIQSKETPLSAGLKAVGAGTIERFSEFAGGYIPAVGKFLPKSLTARVGASKVGRYISRTMNYAPVQSARKAVQLQGFGGEFAEELLGGTLNSLIVGDETLEQVYSTDNLQQIGVGLLPLQVAFGGASSVGYTANNIRLRKNVKKNAETLKSVGVDVDALNARLATMNYDEQARAMNSALASAHSAYRSMKKQGGSEKEAILDENLAKLSAEANYIFSYMSYQAHKGASVDVQLEAVQRVQSKADESAKEAMSLDATLNKEHQNYTSVAYRGKTYTVAGGTYNAIPRLKEDGTQETSKSGSYIYDVESDETIYIRDEESGEVIPVPSNEVQALDATMTKEEVKAFYRDRALQLLGEQEEVSGEQILDKNRLQKGSIVEVENEDGTISLAQVIHDSGDAVSVVRENSVHVDVVPRVTVSSEQEEVEEGQAKDGTTIVPEESRNYEVEAGDDVQFEENGTVHRGRVMSVDADVVWVQKDGDAVHVAIPRNEQKVWYAPVHAEEHVEQLDAGKVQEEQPVEESTQLENRFANKPTGVLRSYLSQQKKALEQAKSTLEKMENGEEGAFGDKALSMDEMEFALQQQRELVATLEEEVAELEAELQSRESAEKIEEQPEEQVETPTTKEEVEQEQQEPISQEQQDETGEDGLQEEEPESFDSVKEEKPENQEPARQPNPSPHKNEDGYYGYLDGKTPMQKGRIQKALDKRFDFDGKVLSAYEFIVFAFERGDLSTSVSKYSTERKVKLEKVSKEHTSYEIITAGTSYELGKTAYNFAKYLSNKIGEEQKSTEEVESKVDRNVSPEKEDDNEQSNVSEAAKSEEKTELMLDDFFENFEEAYKEQGKIAGTPEGKKKFDSSLWSFVSDDEKKPVLKGVLHDNGYIVATDGHLLIAEKYKYPRKKEGKVEDKNGEIIDGKFPVWNAIFSDKGNKTISFDANELSSQLRTIRKIIKDSFELEKEKETNKTNNKKNVGIKSYVNTYPISVRFEDGSIRVFKMKDIELFANAAHRLGINSFYSDKNGFIKSIEQNGFLAIVPVYLGNYVDMDSDFSNPFLSTYIIDLTDNSPAKVSFSRYTSAKKENEHNKEIVSSLVEQLEKSGLAKSVVVDKEAFDKKLEELDGKRLHTVYHGSPHSFEAFDHSKMGSGEGAQAFGWGTYVTEVEGIARKYAKNVFALNKKRPEGYNEAIERKRELEDKVWEKDRKRGEAKYWYEKFLKEKDGLERILRDPSHDPFGKPNLFFADFNFGQSFFSAEESLEERVKKIEDRLRVINEYILPEKKKALDEARKVVKDAEKELEEAKKEVERLAPKRHLYTVEVPDVTTNKYLVYNGIYDKERLVSLLDDIESRLQAFGVNTTEEVRGQASFSDWRKRVFEEGNDWETGVLSGKEIYEKLSNTLQGDKEASMFLSSLGFVGISYPAQYTTGGRADGARNFVIFKEEDAKITEHVQFLKGGGTVYGFVVDGVVYLNPSVLNTNTPIHEFAHLWDSLIQQIKPELYAEGTKLVKDSEYWEEVNRNPHYAGLSEAERVDEALAMAIGDFGAKKVKKYGIKGASFRAWLNKVWRSVKEFLGIKSQYKSIADFANRSLEDLLGGTKIGQAQGVSGFQTTKSGLTPEMEEIKTKAQSDGSFMKAPNGKPTNLNERQWLQVRTQAFKDWFGDWEKASRVEKLRQSSIVSISGKEIEPSEDIKQYKKNALEYGKRLQGSYVNKDTGKTISLQRGRKRGGINEVLQHDYKDAEHLQSISAIPRIIENAIYIDSLANLDDKLDADTFDYYVVGIQIGGVDYTVRAVVVNTKNGETYYDHKLSKIEKGKLLDLIESQGANISDFGTTPDSKSTITDFSGVKDIKLVSLLQTNSSKVVDENGEPLVVYHGTGAKFNAFSTKKTATPMFYFTSERHKIEEGVVGAKSSGRIVEAYLNMRKPAGWSEDDRLTTDQIKHKGYDGKALLDDGYNVYVAFYPNQIKSATDNVGTFDGENADIRFQRGLFDDVDTPYFDAIERGDMETVQRLVDERAEAMGYTRQEDYKDAHFAPVANVEKEDFDNIDVLREEVEENGIDTNLFAVAQGVHSQPDDYFSPKGARYYGYNDNDGMESYTALSNVIRSIQYQIKENGEVSDMPYITVYRAVPNYIDGAFLESEGQWVSPSKSYVESHGASRFGDGEYKVIEQEVPATHLWWDGNDIREWGFDDGNIYRYKNTKNNLKMNDAIVRDENGEIIPLSKRFDENNPNVLYRRTEAEKTANEKFNKQLEAFEKGVLNTPLNFGPPSGWLKLLSLPSDGEMKMSLKDLQGHLKKHSLSVGDIRDLPMFLSEPLLVYEWGTKSPSLVIITSMPRGEERITVALRISRKGKNMEVNEIASIHSKNSGRFLQDMIIAKEGGLQQALRLVPNKQKALNWLGLVPPKGTASQANQELSSIAKIIEDFENPKLEDGGTSDALTSRTHEQRMSDNKTAYDKLFDRAGVEKVVDSVVNRLNTPVKVRVVSRNDLKGRAKKSKGFYNSKTGEVSIVLENARSENDITQTILHEVVGHKGLDALFDKEKRDAIFDSVASSIPEDSREFLRTFYPNASERELGAEYIAHLAEHYVEPSFIRKMASYVRSLLRSVGFNVKYSDGDIMTLLHRGVVALRKQSATSDEVLAYQIQEERVRKNMEYFDELEVTNDKELFFRATEDEREQVLSIADKFHKQGNGERLKEVWYDATSSIKKFQDEVEKASGKKIPDYINIHKIFNQTTSKASNLEQRMVEKWEDIAKRSRKLKRDIGLNDEQFKLYIFAQHAPERNELMRKNAVDEYLRQCEENGWVPDSKVLFEKENGDYASQRELEKSIKASFSAQSNSSIIGFETCQDLTSAISAIGGDEVTELWQEINALNKWILRTWYDGGLMSKSAFEKVSAMYKFYVPMQGFQEETASDVWEYYNKPKGVSSIIKTAKGRKSIAEDPFIIIRRNISSAVSLSAKNKEKQAVYNLVQAFKNDYVTIGSVWYVRKGEKWEASYPKDGSPEAIAEHEKEMDRLKENGDASLFSNQNKPNLGIKIDKTNAKEHVISVRFNGEERRLYVNGNPTLAHAINRTNVPELGGLLKAIKWVTQSMAANVTGRSLDFLTANVVRDLIWSRNAWVRWGWSAKDFIPNYLRSWGYIIGLNKSDETETLWKEFSENGGITGYSASISERKAKKITKYQFSNSAKSNLKRGLNRAFGAFVQFNEKAEQSARFGAYITARQKGESIISSIDKAKEITVNFSRHGSGNSLLYKAFAPFYMFMNANVQGVGVYFGMAIRNPIRFGIMMIAVPMMGRSVLEAVMSLAGGDDEEYQYINEFVRKSNVCVPLGDGKFVKIPLAPADRAWWGLADSFFSFTKGKKDATQFALSFVDASIDVASFVPILGGANIGEAVSDYRAGQSADLYPAWRGVVPDPAKPFTDLLFNRNFTGGKIDKTNSFNQHLPNYKRVGDNVPEFMVGVSEWLNKAMVGKYLGEAEKSPIDFLNNPTAVQYLVYSYFGGIAKTVDQVANVADSSIDGKPVGETLSVAPVVNRFYKQDPRLKEKYEAREFYTERETIKKLNKSVGALEKMWEKASTEEERDGIERDVKKKLGKMDYETYLQKKHFFDECDRVLKVARDNLNVATGTERDVAQKELDSIIQEALEIHSTIK